MKFLVLAVAALTAACSVPVDVVAPIPEMSVSRLPLAISSTWTLVVDTDVPLDVEEELISAALDWRDAIPCPVSFVVTRGTTSTDVDGPIPMGTIEVRMGRSPLNGEVAIGWAKWRDDGHRGGRVVLGGTELPRVTRHELGHAMGLEHDDGGDGVMMAAGNVDHVTARDAASYASRWCPAR